MGTTKFRYIWKYREDATPNSAAAHQVVTRTWVIEEFTLDQIQEREFGYRLTKMQGENYELIARLQFTGQTDKNGKEIYDGDRVQHFDFRVGETFTVEWEEEDGAWTGWGMFHEWSECEVVNNIYENPEEEVSG